jgi:hypothetical protein
VIKQQGALHAALQSLTYELILLAADLMTRLMAVLRWIIDQAEGNRAFTLRFVK